MQRVEGTLVVGGSSRQIIMTERSAVRGGEVRELIEKGAGVAENRGMSFRKRSTRLEVNRSCAGIKLNWHIL